MNTRRLTFSTALLGAASLSLLSVGAQAQTITATTDPVGYTTESLLANSDTLVSIPFTRPAAFTGAISSVSGNTITLAGSPGFLANQYVYAPTAATPQTNTYYAIIGPLNAALTGTLTASNGSTAVTGSGTTFGTDVQKGDVLNIGGAIYTVAAVTSATTLTLDKVYAGTTASALAATYDHSPKEGSFYTVTANGTGSLTVNLNGDSLTSVAANTSVSLIPYWTLGTAFPATDANVSYVPSTSPSVKTRQTQILLPDMVTAGTNLASSAIYYNYNSAWRLVGSPDSSVSYNDVVLPPTNYFTLRNASAATTFTPSGSVYMNRFSTPLDTQTTLAQDNAVAVPRPTAVALNDLGLIASGAFTASASASVKTRADQLLVYDNTQAGTNKSASAIYYYSNNAWRLVGAPDSSVDYGATTIPYGTGFTIRKALNTAGTTSFWQNARNY